MDAGTNPFAECPPADVGMEKSGDRGRTSESTTGRDGAQTRTDAERDNPSDHRLSEKEAELKVLQRLFENARIAMGKDVRTLRLNLRENEPCPVCGGTDHPYRNEEQVVHSLYQNIEQEYQNRIC